MTTDNEAAGQRSRRRGWIVAIVVVLALAIAGVVVWQVASTPGASTDAGATPTATATDASPSPTPGIPVQPGATPTVVPSPPSSEGPLPPEMDPVGPTDRVEEAGVAASIATVESVQGQAALAGEISGPALRMTFLIENGSDDAVDLGYAVANAYFGADRTPAGTVMQPGGNPFQGTLEPGESAQGTYLFSISEADRGAVTVTLDFLPGQPTAVFVGDFR